MALGSPRPGNRGVHGRDLAKGIIVPMMWTGLDTVLASRAAGAPGALAFAEGGESLSYGRLRAESEALAGGPARRAGAAVSRPGGRIVGDIRSPGRSRIALHGARGGAADGNATTCGGQRGGRRLPAAHLGHLR